ncbi:adhesion G protein-coupled receptor A3 isoform X2 [Adelges cooleyi]|uniref:adhesion G protein-coupled receptor A3 isoform X2 n=1 Tax=Adelges cooleyi TaxID=133065 RepID=UPI00217FA470|nr:adhesion G protein-coupled receptor A3 isoform X2 [Adelges cooleyi]
MLKQFNPFIDLTKNLISIIQDGAFRGTPNLKILTLTDNKLKNVSQGIFEGLFSLEQLKLNKNFLAHISANTFNFLNHLSRLDISDNPLVCDCEITGFLEWVKRKIKLGPKSECHEPPSLKDTPIKNLRPDMLNCLRPKSNTPPAIEIIPTSNLVLFEGDSIDLLCRAVGTDAVEGIVLTWNAITSNSSGSITIIDGDFKNTGLIQSNISIPKLNANHTGKYECTLNSTSGIRIQTIAITVISNKTRFCSVDESKDNKGSYIWTRTISDVVTVKQCQANDEVEPLARGTVSRHCNWNGKWDLADSSDCPYISPITRIFYTQSKTNITHKDSSETARQLFNYTRDHFNEIKDYLDISYIADIVDDYLDIMREEKLLAPVVIDLISLMAELPKDLLLAAQKNDKSTSRLVNALETALEFTTTLNSRWTSAIAMEDFIISKENFSGLTCVWGRDEDSPTTMNSLMCYVYNNHTLPHNKIIDVLIEIPGSLFASDTKKQSSELKLVFTVYEDGKMFPEPMMAADDNVTLIPTEIKSCVLVSKLVGIDMEVTPEPIIIALRQPENYDRFTNMRPSPSWWNPLSGLWDINPNASCELAHIGGGMLVYRCNRFGYFALTMSQTSIRNLLSPINSTIKRKTLFSQTSIYIGTFMGSTFLLFSVVLYVILNNNIQMAKKLKHSLPNTWFAMSMFYLVYCNGIHRTENARTCQIIGLLIQFFSLASMFWMTVTIKVLYKRVRKPFLPASTPSDDGGMNIPHEDIVVKKPLLGIYMVGWGIPMLLCGMSSAVNLPGYGGHEGDYCFLKPGPAFGFIVVVALVVICCIIILSMLVSCAANNLDSNVQLSEGTQATDLELLDQTNSMVEHNSCRSLTTPSSKVEDPEQSPVLQLRFFNGTLLGYLLTVAMAYFNVVIMYSPTVQLWLGVWFACFNVFQCFLIMWFYVFVRNDVQNALTELKDHRWGRKKVVDSVRAPSIRTDSFQSVRPKSNSEVVSLQSFRSPQLQLVMMRHQLNSERQIDYYNPHQITVAKKFFKKQRRKQNNLPRRPPLTSPDLTDNGYFCHNGKTNNLHLDLKHNGGVFSDSVITDHEYVEVDGRSQYQHKYTQPREYSTEEFVTSQMSGASCEGISDSVTDCGRNISEKENCSSPHVIVSDCSSANPMNHTYETITPIKERRADSSKRKKDQKKSQKSGYTLTRTNKSDSDENDETCV